MTKIRQSEFMKNDDIEIRQKRIRSGIVPWVIAKEMHEEYLENPDAFKIETPEGVKILKGIKLESLHVKNILEGKNQHGIALQEPASQLYIMFGVREQDFGMSSEKQFFTFILAGLDNNNQLLPHVVYDHYVPCDAEIPVLNNI
jgi:hypothetical protein